MAIVLAVVLAAAGFASWFHRWIWSMLAAFAVLVAWENWASGAYSDSGNPVGYSALIMGMVLGPAAVGAVLGWAIAKR